MKKFHFSSRFFSFSHHEPTNCLMERQFLRATDYDRWMKERTINSQRKKKKSILMDRCDRERFSFMALFHNFISFFFFLHFSLCDRDI